MKYLKILLIIQSIILMYSQKCGANIWDYATEGVYDFPYVNGGIYKIKGKLLNLDVVIKGFYKNGEDLYCTSSTRIIQEHLDPDNNPYEFIYHLDTSFFKEIFGELEPACMQWSSNSQEKFQVDYFYDDPHRYNSYVYNKSTLLNIHDDIEWWPNHKSMYIWNESVYYLGSFTFINDEFVRFLYGVNYFIFQVSGNQIEWKLPSNNSGYYNGIMYEYNHRHGDYGRSTKLDENYFCFTEMRLILNDSYLNQVEQDIDLTFNNGLISTSSNCHIYVFNLNGINVAGTIGDSLDISYLDRGTYIIKAQNKTLKIHL